MSAADGKSVSVVEQARSERDAGRRLPRRRRCPCYTSVAVCQADAGAHVVAPSGMMDGQVRAIRHALDGAGFTETVILAYAAKYASAWYGPFRDAAECAPQHSDRSTYQQNASFRRIVNPAGARRVPTAPGADARPPGSRRA